MPASFVPQPTFVVVRPTRFNLPRANDRTSWIPEVQLEERLRYHTCVSYSVGTPCKCTRVCEFFSYVVFVCSFPYTDRLGYKSSNNAIEKCCAVCSPLITLACISCVSRTMNFLYKPLCLLSDKNWKWFPDKKLDKARSLLYRSQILQENVRWKALAEIYTMHSFAPFSCTVLVESVSKLNFFVKNCWTFCWFFKATFANL